MWTTNTKVYTVVAFTVEMSFEKRNVKLFKHVGSIIQGHGVNNDRENDSLLF